MFKPNVVHIITRVEFGGTFKVLKILFKHFNNKHNITLITGYSANNSYISELCEKYNVKLVFIPELVRNPSPIRDLIVLYKLIKILKKNNYDLVHTHTSKAGFIGRLSANIRNIKCVHSTHGHIFYGYFNFSVTRFFIFLEQLAAKWCDKIVVLSNREVNDHLRLKIGDKKHFIVIPNGIDVEENKLLDNNINYQKRVLGIFPDTKVILSIGRLSRIKGHKYLIEAFGMLSDKYPNWRLIIVGEGNMRKTLERQVYKLRLSKKVIFTGAKKHIKGLLDLCDIFVLPSLNEGFGLSIIEAQFAKKPVIATRVGGVSDIISEDTGVLVPPSDSYALKEAIKLFIENEKYANKLAIAGYNNVIKKFSVNKMIDRYEKLYNSIIVNNNL